VCGCRRTGLQPQPFEIGRHPQKIVAKIARPLPGFEGRPTEGHAMSRKQSKPLPMNPDELRVRVKLATQPAPPKILQPQSPQSKPK